MPDPDRGHAQTGCCRLAITGRPGSGKTTLCRRLIASLPLTAGGVLTQEVRDERGRRLGFEILDIATGEKGTLAHIHLEEGPRVGRYRVNLPDIEGIAVPAIEHALESSDLIVIDEIAPMELESAAFIRAVERALAGDRPLLVTFQRRSRHPLVERVRRVCRVYELTEKERNQLLRRLVDELRSVSVRRKDRGLPA